MGQLDVEVHLPTNIPCRDSIFNDKRPNYIEIITWYKRLALSRGNSHKTIPVRAGKAVNRAVCFNFSLEN